MKRGSVTFLALVIMMIGVFVFALCIFWLPIEARNAAIRFPEFAHLRYPILIGLYITAIPFYLALYQSLNLLRFIKRNKAFSNSAVASLRQIKNDAFIIITLYGIGIVFLMTQNALHPGIALMGLTIIFTSFIIFLFAEVLRKLLRNALDLKLENDFTV
ncbi:DUF2975 domain-containing protein [Oceanobacillus bengalensis]|uniref:DUF2975 domain-containing protein n=1 Tax=Oceanobacillus bengalensis TaxID=1435466 RepID=A0A494YS56_9BACI|nr:DUF2975 domain-containing protein [Oceanobacillus bengalensis]RKQ12463.1 DUF2975 domain-containing protein [Oceanobacillus bengalensis]